ncbi:3784_t:CDS:1, partial [Funneliformis geosporum]
QELTNKLTEQEEILKQRPDITNEKYQELLNNQEKHQEEELKPENLPTD